MTDKPKIVPVTEILPVTDPLHVTPVFVNQLAGSGHLNGVVNLTFACALFSPKDDGSVAPDLVVTSRLRMDLFCAQQLHTALGQILEANLRPTNGTTH